eukprot:10924739-Alexandrium_andersonii.AAC.1
MRDLGTHLSTGGRMRGATVAARIMAANEVAARIACIHAPFRCKLRAVEAKVLPMALYGVACVPTPRDA